MVQTLGVCLAALAWGVSSAWAQAPVQNAWADLYAQTCSTCHQGGGGGAPRLNRAEEWRTRLPRGLDALTLSAVRGVPNTAMLPKGGYELTDAQVRGLVDWMMRQVSVPTVSGVIPEQTLGGARQGLSRAEVPLRGNLAQQLALGLRSALGQSMQALEAVESQTWLIRGLGIRIRAEQGVVTLSGTVEDAKTVDQAGAWVSGQPGVQQVINRLVAATLFEWD
jgi:cytochrome c5